jgi:hypothetical protein
MRVLKEVEVLIARDQRNSQTVETFREQLFQTHSELTHLL